MSVNLKKGANISLAKEAPGLSVITLGLGWGKKVSKGLFGVKKLKDIDLDASCVLFDDDQKVVDKIWWRNLKSSDGSVHHTGDDTRGGGADEDANEGITVKLNKVSSHVTSIFVTVNSFGGDSFDGIPNAFCNLQDSNSGAEIARYDLSVEGGARTGVVIAKLYRHKGEWKFKALGEWGDGSTVDSLIPLMMKL